MTRRHHLSGAAFDALATADELTDAVHALRRSQYSRRALLLRAVLDEAARRCPAAYQAAQPEAAFRLLAEVQGRSPLVVREVLLHPAVGAWAAVTLRRLVSASGQIDAVTADLHHLGAIAAAAALHGDRNFAATVPVNAGRMVLPTVGCVELVPGASTVPTAVVQRQNGSTHVRWGATTLALPSDISRDGTSWRAIPRLTASAAGRRISVFLDDIDPYRRYLGLAPATRLPKSELMGWQARFDEAWEILARHHPIVAEAMAAGMSSLVPLDATGPDSVSGTSADALGAAAITLPGSGTDLAVALVHELQHSKLEALHELVPLWADGDDDQLYYAPWRDDPRPLRGLLHGCYAYFGIAGFWRVQRHVAAGRESDLANFEFARWRGETWRTSLLLLNAPTLTPAGRRFVGVLRRSLARWWSDVVSATASDAANMVARDHEITWRLRNLRPDPVQVETMARAWASGRPCPVDAPPATEVRPGVFAPAVSVRAMLLHQRLWGPRQVTKDSADPDIQLTNGNYASAAAGYRARIDADPFAIAAWSGLALARAGAANGIGADALLRWPETVAALHRQVVATTGTSPDPDALANWLGAIRC